MRRGQNHPLFLEFCFGSGSKDLYLDFLGQAYHHVKCTAPLLALAAARCGADDRPYQAALFEYVKEECGHDEWILKDIEVLGGDSEAARQSSPRFPCKVMIGHAYYLVDRVSPYAMLGMIHVLDGMSVALAGRAVERLCKTIPGSADAGFKYLTTHSDLDIEHTKFFEELICTIDPRHLPLVIDSACDFYRLYGAIFQDLDARRTPNTNGSLSNDVTRA
jgi:pyrroloquinoline quinone (PQQ) biosynthesis protein C